MNLVERLRGEGVRFAATARARRLLILSLTGALVGFADDVADVVGSGARVGEEAHGVARDGIRGEAVVVEHHKERVEAGKRLKERRERAGERGH